MVKFVENELQTIKQEVNDMWELVQKQFENARAAVLSGDRNLAAVVIGREKRVNSFELRIDSGFHSAVQPGGD